MDYWNKNDKNTNKQHISSRSILLFYYCCYLMQNVAQQIISM